MKVSFVVQFINRVEVVVEQIPIGVFTEPHVPCGWDAAFDKYDYFSVVC